MASDVHPVHASYPKWSWHFRYNIQSNRRYPECSPPSLPWAARLVAHTSSLRLQNIYPESMNFDKAHQPEGSAKHTLRYPHRTVGTRNNQVRASDDSSRYSAWAYELPADRLIPSNHTSSRCHHHVQGIHPGNERIEDASRPKSAPSRHANHSDVLWMYFEGTTKPYRQRTARPVQIPIGVLPLWHQPVQPKYLLASSMSKNSQRIVFQQWFGQPQPTEAILFHLSAPSSC